MKSISCRVIATILMLGCMGCAGNTETEFTGQLEPVSGVATLNGVPYAGMEVRFFPVEGTPGTGGTAVTDADGKFTLKHRSGKPGVEAGDYKVVFSLVLKADGTPLAPDEDAATLGRERLPQKYLTLEQTPEKAKVPSGGGEFPFRLVDKK